VRSPAALIRFAVEKMHKCSQPTLSTLRNTVSVVSTLLVLLCDDDSSPSHLGQAYTTTGNILLCTNQNAHKELVEKAIIGGVVGGVLFIFLVLFMFCWYRRFQDIPAIRLRFSSKKEDEEGLQEKMKEKKEKKERKEKEKKEKLPAYSNAKLEPFDIGKVG
jgi:hypothetical protein